MVSRSIAGVALLTLVTTSCATWMVPVADNADSPVRISVTVGDTVRILTKHGERPTFLITEITEEALVGKDQRIRYDEMAFVEKRARKRSVSEDVATGAMLVVVGSLVVLASLGSVDFFDAAMPQ